MTIIDFCTDVECKYNTKKPYWLGKAKCILPTITIINNSCVNYSAEPNYKKGLDAKKYRFVKTKIKINQENHP